MKLLIVADGHYYIDRKKNVYVESVFDYNFYSRYLAAFDSVYAIVRAEKVDEVPAGCKLASGKGVYFLPIPPSKGVKQYALNYFENQKLIKKYISKFECAIFRIPGVVANAVLKKFEKTGKPYAIEVVVDPWEYFAKGTVQGITRPFVRRAWTYSLKRSCMKANGVSYVTQRYLQKKYPCKAIVTQEQGYFTSSYSSVELPDEKFGTAKKYAKKDKYIISHVANAFTGYGKGHVTLMKAAKLVIERGYNIEVWFVGDGPLRHEFETIASELGISNSVRFLGRMPSGDVVRERIKESDLFVFPTRAEGLPRVVLEAMAEGIPVLSSPVCGIPEILPKECLVDYDDFTGYANAIIKMLENPDIMSKHSKRNLNVSKQYKSSVLNEKRKEFYMRLREMAEK